jgi:hypothetical protein
VTLSDRGVNVTLPKSRVGQRRRIRFAATVSGQAEDGSSFEEKATVRDISLQGAYLTLKSHPKLQSELRVVIEAAGDENRSSVLSLRGTVIHFDLGREKGNNGVGVVFIEEPEPGHPND